jgi:Tfp pilus assembly protein PilN
MSSSEKIKYSHKKVNLIGFMILSAVAIATGYMVFGTEAQHSNLVSKISSNERLEKERDKKMAENPMYMRLNTFGASLSAIKSVDQLKDASPAWSEFIFDLARNFPKSVFVKDLTYAADRSVVTLTLNAADRGNLVKVMSSLEDNDALREVNFETITKDDVTFPGEKVQRKAFSVLVTFLVDSEWLKKQYDFSRELKSTQPEIVIPPPRNREIESTEPVSTTSSTGTTSTGTTNIIN